MKLFLDPKMFNYVIMSLYVLNAGRWTWFGSYGDACCWLSAFAITASVTWGFQR